MYQPIHQIFAWNIDRNKNIISMSFCFRCSHFSGFFGHRDRHLYNQHVWNPSGFGKCPLKLSRPAPPAVSQRGILRPFLADQLAFDFPRPPHHKAGLAAAAPGRWMCLHQILWHPGSIVWGISNLRKIEKINPGTIDGNTVKKMLLLFCLLPHSQISRLNLWLYEKRHAQMWPATSSGRKACKPWMLEAILNIW